MISVVIPFKDEVARLRETVERVRGFFDDESDFEILLVDDGSVDGSAASVLPLVDGSGIKLFQHERNLGKGAAIRTGVLQARGDHILFSDADLATPITELPKLLEAVMRGPYAIAIASRAVPGSVIRRTQAWPRVLIGKAGNLFVRVLLGLPYKDTQCGFKLFRRDIAKELFREQLFPRWSFDIEILYRAKKGNMYACEVPVEWRHVDGSHVRPVRDSLRVLLDVVKMKRVL